MSTFWQHICLRYQQPDRDDVDWTVSRFLTYFAFAVFVISLTLPAAMLETIRWEDADPVGYCVASGAVLLAMSFLFGFHPLGMLYFFANISLAYRMVAIFFRPSFLKLRGRIFWGLVAQLIAFSGWGTVERYTGWWLWNLSFLLTTLAHLWPLMHSPDRIARTKSAVERQPE